MEINTATKLDQLASLLKEASTMAIGIVADSNLHTSREIAFVHDLEDKAIAIRAMSEEFYRRHKMLEEDNGTDNLRDEVIDQLYTYAEDLQNLVRKYYPNLVA